MQDRKIRVLIADDSALVREILKDVIESEPDLELVGAAINGRLAVELAQELRPDIITMDVMMPVMNGLEAVEEIMAFCPTPILVFSSAVNNAEMDVAFQAITRGALDVLEKPKVPSGEQFERVRTDLVSKLRLLSRIHVISHIKGKRAKRPGRRPEPDRAAPPPAATRERRPEPSPRRETAVPGPSGEKRLEPDHALLVALPPPERVRRKIVAIGASTGGPKALVHIFRRLPAAFPLPILVVQHIAHSFAPGLVNWLDREAPMRVVLAEDRAAPAPGVIYIAPTGLHLEIERGQIRLTDGPAQNACKPAVDALFHAVARDFEDQAVGALLTGMGKDGAVGLAAMKKKRAKTIVQDQETCVIFGMPKVAMELGAADHTTPLGLIPEAIVKALV